MIRKIVLLTLLIVLIPTFAVCQSMSTVERQYKWYAEEKITVSNTVKQLTSAEYSYIYVPTRIDVEDNNAQLFVLNEAITDATTGAMGLLRGYSDSNHPTYLDIQILYNGLDAAGFDPNDVLSGADANCVIQATDSYSRGDAEGYGSNMEVNPQIAEVFILDNSLLYTLNGANPVYESSDDPNCFGEKHYEGDVFYIFGTEAIVNFKAIRNGSSDCFIYVRYGI